VYWGTCKAGPNSEHNGGYSQKRAADCYLWSDLRTLLSLHVQVDGEMVPMVHSDKSLPCSYGTGFFHSNYPEALRQYSILFSVSALFGCFYRRARCNVAGHLTQSLRYRFSYQVLLQLLRHVLVPGAAQSVPSIGRDPNVYVYISGAYG